MLITIWPLLIALIGLVVFALSSNAKVSEIGKWMFIVGLFWVVFALTGKSVKFLS